MLLDHKIKEDSHLFHSLLDAMHNAQRVITDTNVEANDKEFDINDKINYKLATKNHGFRNIFQKIDNNNKYHLIGSDESTTYAYQSDLE